MVDFVFIEEVQNALEKLTLRVTHGKRCCQQVLICFKIANVSICEIDLLKRERWNLEIVNEQSVQKNGMNIKILCDCSIVSNKISKNFSGCLWIMRLGKNTSPVPTLPDFGSYKCKFLFHVSVFKSIILLVSDFIAKLRRDCIRWPNERFEKCFRITFRSTTTISQTVHQSIRSFRWWGTVPFLFCFISPYFLHLTPHLKSWKFKECRGAYWCIFSVI